MSFDDDSNTSSNDELQNFDRDESRKENDEDSISTSSQFLPISELPDGHRISFLDNGVSEGCEWLLLYSVNSYGLYLIPSILVPKPALRALLENNGAKEVPEAINFICKFVDNERYHRKWAPYIPLCFTYFIGEALRVHDLVDDEDPSHLTKDMLFRVVLQYFFVDYFMAYSPRSKVIEVRKLWDTFHIEWKKKPEVDLEEQMKFAKEHVNKLLTNNISVPNFIVPSLYPWDFVNHNSPFDITECPFVDE